MESGKMPAKTQPRKAADDWDLLLGQIVPLGRVALTLLQGHGDSLARRDAVLGGIGVDGLGELRHKQHMPLAVCLDLQLKRGARGITLDLPRLRCSNQLRVVHQNFHLVPIIKPGEIGDLRGGNLGGHHNIWLLLFQQDRLAAGHVPQLRGQLCLVLMRVIIGPVLLGHVLVILNVLLPLLPSPQDGLVVDSLISQGHVIFQHHPLAVIDIQACQCHLLGLHPDQALNLLLQSHPA
mmetsp:Transcript_47716/g.126202  ORF Transcript_47716/g.126202 Transcript_47716/m.126202 type:complete len:236 (+) Transcript_47716:607-1314(+)